MRVEGRQIHATISVLGTVRRRSAANDPGVPIMMDARAAREMLAGLLLADGRRSGTSLTMQLLGTSSRIVLNYVYSFERSYRAYFVQVAETIQLRSKRREGWERAAPTHHQDVKERIIQRDPPEAATTSDGREPHPVLA